MCTNIHNCVICLAVEADANEALQQVDSVQETSQQNIDTSSALRTQLQPIRTKSQAAWNTAKAALTLAQEDNEVGTTGKNPTFPSVGNLIGYVLETYYSPS